jgi:hypothetical protein
LQQFWKLRLRHERLLLKHEAKEAVREDVFEIDDGAG